MIVPTVVFSHPTSNYRYEKKRPEKNTIMKLSASFNPMFYALSQDEKIKTSMKLITQGDDSALLDVTSLVRVPMRCYRFAVAAKNGATKKDFDSTVAIHPTSAEELVTMR